MPLEDFLDAADIDEIRSETEDHRGASAAPRRGRDP
jgi:hypothetical protein